MNRLLKSAPFFLFFCLSCSDQIGPYRDIEIIVLNVDFATVRFYNPDSTIIATEYFDRTYSESLHIGYIPDGRLRIEVQTEMNKQAASVDTVIDYRGRFGWAVEF
ncbi:hypothetical protein DSL64_21500 [Dyadobacter luteus]|uniref:Uncharacterized protein n=1 Tax=Dyadobacter luteus TaxID=2259619 RepID=A0A3D8Y690_9BACT|nr:hypothetical protein [Dyadobacter luteus]REA58186.1 hypothetical protein DSL64_21500 [Dyadobacter luteus]